MEAGAIVILAIWLIFLLIYIGVRTVFPDLAKGNRKWKKKKKFDADGFDRNGWSALGFYRNGTRYDDNGLDRYGNPRPEGERTDLRAFDPVEAKPWEEEDET